MENLKNDPILPGTEPQLQHYAANLLEPAFGHIQQNADSCVFGLHRDETRKHYIYNYMGCRATYEELDADVERVFRALYALGVRQGDCVTIALPNVPEVIKYTYGTFRLGGIAALVDPRTNGLGIAQRTIDTKSKALVVLLDLCDPKIDEILAVLPDIPVIVVSPADSFRPTAGLIPFLGGIMYGKKMKAFQAARTDRFGFVKEEKGFYRLYGPDGEVRSPDPAAGAPLLPQKEGGHGYYIRHADFVKLDKDQWDCRGVYYEDMPAAILYTSGTASDGVIKGAVHTHASLNAAPGNLQFALNREHFGHGKTFGGFIPFFSAYGLFNGLHSCLYGDVEMLMIPVFDPNHFADVILKYKPNIFLSVPGFVEQLTRHPKLQKKSKKLSFITIPISGGDKISPAAMAAVNDCFARNGCKSGVRVGYGSSEFGGSISLMPHYDPNDTATFDWHTEGNTGYLLPGIKALVIDPDTGEVLPPNTPGEIVLHSKSMMLKYLNAPEPTEEITWFDSDGVKYFRMGDKGRIDERGAVYFIDRYKRSIMRPDGHTVHPSPIENVIMNHEAVQTAAVVGVAREGLSGAIPMAFVVLKEEYRNGDDAQIEKILREIDGFCFKLLPGRDKAMCYKAVDALPMTPMGKVHFRELEKTPFDPNNCIVTDSQFVI
ncbi:MAG: AMP-binding protein [Oscillospiraceae bacterium]|jgi:long-chain acyl-CoA synthetase|nr:AMP-binding protein [Oscillospiraceae bacterium]